VSGQDLFFDLADQGSIVLARLEGVITEDNGLQDRLAEIHHRKVLLNLAKVERINSCGVRDWIRWVQDLERRGNSIHLVQCSPAVIAQINMVRNFCGALGHVISFQAPYLCETCDEEREETFLSASISGKEAPPALCQTCGEQMEFDDLPDSYFAFLREHGTRATDADVHGAMNKFEDAHLATKIAALKELTTARGLGTPGPSTPGTGLHSSDAAPTLDAAERRNLTKK
jgi:anti-anti-sigma regulatory factor